MFDELEPARLAARRREPFWAGTLRVGLTSAPLSHGRHAMFQIGYPLVVRPEKPALHRLDSVIGARHPSPIGCRLDPRIVQFLPNRLKLTAHLGAQLAQIGS